MGKVVKCSSCNSYYNGAIYSSCPYCNVEATGAATHGADKSKGLLGFLGKKSSQGGEATAPSESIAISKTVSMQNSSSQKNAAGLSGPTVPLPEPHSNAPDMTLSQAISRSGRTVGKYISAGNGESVAPVVGWIVAVKGSCIGLDFKLKSGRNKIGRSHEMDVKLLNDDSVSRNSVAVLIYDPKTGEFSIAPGESDSLCYVDGKALYSRVILTGYEKLEFGDKGYNQYIFVPFCGSRFRWSDFNREIQ